jgi:hypothetical protein
MIVLTPAGLSLQLRANPDACIYLRTHTGDLVRTITCREAESLADDGLVLGTGNRNVPLKYVRLVDDKSYRKAIRMLRAAFASSVRIGAADSKTSTAQTLVTRDGNVVKVWTHIRTSAWAPRARLIDIRRRPG